MFPADAVAAAPVAPPPAPLQPPSHPVAPVPSLESSLDDMFNQKEAAPPAEPQKTPEPPKEAPKQQAPPAEDKFVDDMIDDEPAETPKPEAAKDPKEEPKKEAPKEEPVPSFKTPKELREAYKTVNREKFGLIERNSKLTKEIEELKRTGGSSAEVKALTEEITNLKKTLQQQEERLGGYDYASTTEFQQKYQEPLKQATQRAFQFIPQLEVSATDANGEPITRPATWADFQALYQLPPSKLDKAAHDMFGHSAPRVIQHIDRIKELGEIADQAQANAVNLAKERTQKVTAEQAQAREIQVKSFHEATKSLIEKYPEFFGESEDDAEGTELLRKGLAWADQVFSGKTASLPPEKRAQMDAIMRLRAAGFSRVAAANKSLKAQLAAAKAELEGIRATKPKIGNDAPAPKVTTEGDIFAGIDNIPAFRR